jgi:hypothetical protein
VQATADNNHHRGGRGMKTKRVILIIAAVFLAIAYLVVLVMLNPTWWPNSQIEKLLLKEIPLGTTRDEAREIIKNNNWRIKAGDSKGITVFLGPSYIPISWAEADFKFDDDGCLVAVYVIKLMTGI